MELQNPTTPEEQPIELDGIPAQNLSEAGIEIISRAKNGQKVGSNYLTNNDFSAKRNGEVVDYSIVNNPSFARFDRLLVSNSANTLGDWSSKKVASTNIFNDFPSKKKILTKDPFSGNEFIVSMVKVSDETNPERLIAIYDITQQKEFQLSDKIPQEHIIISDLSYNQHNNLLSYYYIPKTAVSNLSINEGLVFEYNYTLETDFILQREIDLGSKFAIDRKVDIKKPEIEYRSISIFDDIVRFNTQSPETDTQYNLTKNDEFVLSQVYFENFTHDSPYQAKVLDENQSKYTITKDGQEITNLDLRNNLGIFTEVYAKDGYIIVPTTIKGGFPPTVNIILIEEANPENIQVVFDTSKNGEFSPTILNRF